MEGEKEHRSPVIPIKFQVAFTNRHHYFAWERNKVFSSSLASVGVKDYHTTSCTTLHTRWTKQASTTRPEPLKHTHCFKELLLLFFFCACSHYLICTGRGVFERLTWAAHASMPPLIDQVGGKSTVQSLLSGRERWVSLRLRALIRPPYPICFSKELYTNCLACNKAHVPPICQVEIRSESREKR